MANHLPLLVFPEKRIVPPEPGRGFPQSKPHLPGRAAQSIRIGAQMRELQRSFVEYRVGIAGALAGLEPEAVLVIEIVGTVNDFKQAVEAADLEWLGEWDLSDIEPDDEFYELDTHGNFAAKPLKGRLFLSMGSEAGLQGMLALWRQWTEGRPLPYGRAKWAEVFSQLRNIRRWSIEETLRETGMIEQWRELLQAIIPGEEVPFQIELFYRRNALKRQQNERAIHSLLAELGGGTLGPFIDLPEIAFHAVKAILPVESIRQLIDEVDDPNSIVDIQLFNFSGIMYFRPTGQTLAVSEEDEGTPAELDAGEADELPVLALLDGAPLQRHNFLRNRILLDDIFDLDRLYQPGQRRHGTSMASLIVHGDLASLNSRPLVSKLYCVPVMQPDQGSAAKDEHMPNDVFFEDRIHVAVRRMFEGTNDVPPQAPTVKIINISIGDPARPFIHTPSPWARLLDWLSWKYRVIFIVSAGNYPESIEIGLSHVAFSALSKDKRVQATLKSVAASLSSRRLLSPAESLNAITVGALHTDEAGEYLDYPPRIDLMPHDQMFSPAMRVGHGFRRSVKPEVLFAGGRQLYQKPLMNGTTVYSADKTKLSPGQRVAWDSPTEGHLNNTVFTRGTSNATAIASRNAGRIHEMLASLRDEEQQHIPDSLEAVIIKTLLIHGARQPETAKDQLVKALKNESNSRQFKEVVARYIGYGAPDVDRVLTCTDQRATILGFGEIAENEVHEYEFPLPPALSAQKLWRRLIVTLAWLSPINPDHRDLREAKLEMEPGGSTWDNIPLKLKRQDSDHNQVLRGTVQHEVLDGKNLIAAYQDGETLRLRVVCKKDATARLDEMIPYGLAVTLEVKEDVQIPIYQQVRARIRPQVVVGAAQR
ncbi:S8 family peptidase [Massilia atriviolacea]|uniref:S8 family peptidase n=1 Tax=Massilia atriviolacea TaxID=2495579 RepID=A0A430HPF3_9BURK|nr:S8 family peptidase [Massilia atriviolacea]RSZ59391.1 S8 family peptidase [Massilia atriviolacea]